MNKAVKPILETIYGGGLTLDDLALIIFKIRESLDDSFYENPPSLEQKQVLYDLEKVAEKVQHFYNLENFYYNKTPLIKPETFSAVIDSITSNAKRDRK